MVHRELCQLVSDWADRIPAGGGIVEPKLDGIRMLWIDGELVTREGSPIHGAAHIAARLAQIEREQGQPMFFDGEWVVDGSFSATQRHFSASGGRGDAGAFYCFDAFPMSVWRGEEAGETLEARRGGVERLVSGAVSEAQGVRPMPWRWAYTAAEAEEMGREAIAAGGEGVVVKAALGTYSRARTPSWQRIKKALTLDLRIVDTVAQRDCAWKLGALVVDRDGRRVRISAGFSDAERIALWQGRSTLLGTFAEVSAMEITPGGSLRSPSFLRLRPDKEA